MLSNKTILLDYSVFKEPAGFCFPRRGADPPAVDIQRPLEGADHLLLVDQGGEYRARTGDLRLAKPALSQLS